MTDNPPTPDRIPLAHSVRYAVRGLPEVPNQYGPGTLEPHEITLTYRTAPDSQLGRVHAYVAGRIWVDGNELPLLPGGMYGQHYDDGLDNWPEWLAEEARLHDPAAPAVPVPPTTHAEFELRGTAEIRAAALREAAEALTRKANKLTDGLHDLAHFVAKDRLREAEILDREAAELRRMADEAQQQEPTLAAHHAAVPAGAVCKCPGDCGHQSGTEAQQQPVCAECDHPHAAHQEGEDPVSPGRCTACPDSGEEWHDFQPVPGPGRASDEVQAESATCEAPSNAICVCGHSRGEHIRVSGRLLCDACDPDSTDNLVCKEFEAL